MRADVGALVGGEDDGADFGGGVGGVCVGEGDDAGVVCSAVIILWGGGGVGFVVDGPEAVVE